MKNRTVNIVVLVNLALVLLLVTFAPQLMIEPGKLIDAHLELTDDCFNCHTPFIGSTADKCMECHKVKEIGLKTTKGLSIAKEKKNVAFHQKLLEDDCVACHSDHKGVQSFRPIGYFSHELVVQDTRELCDGCHNMPGDALHQKIKGNCSQCHSVDGWKPATLEHEKYFRFDKHHDSTCEKCHIESNYDDYTCYGCHEHSRSKIREEHEEEGIRDYEKCVECHRSGDEDEAEYIWKLKRRGLSPKDYPAYRGKRRGHDDDDDDDDDRKWGSNDHYQNRDVVARDWSRDNSYQDRNVVARDWGRDNSYQDRNGPSRVDDGQNKVDHGKAMLELEAKYQAQGAGSFSAAAGEALWNKTFVDAKSGKERNCTLCHTTDLTKQGMHARTGKVIEPMAPSVNSKRLTDVKYIKKWFIRDCKGTLGRECTAQEKGDVLAYLKSL